MLLKRQLQGRALEYHLKALDALTRFNLSTSESGGKEDPALFSEMTSAASEAFFFEKMIATLNLLLEGTYPDGTPVEFVEQRVTVIDL